MRNLAVPLHRVEKVVNTLYERWSETKQQPNSRPIPVFGRYAQEHDGMYGCYAAFCVNNIVYIDSELYGRFDSESDLMLVAQVMELQTKWANGDYKEAIQNKIVSQD